MLISNKNPEAKNMPIANNKVKEAPFVRYIGISKVFKFQTVYQLSYPNQQILSANVDPSKESTERIQERIFIKLPTTQMRKQTKNLKFCFKGVKISYEIQV